MFQFVNIQKVLDFSDMFKTFADPLDRSSNIQIFE